MRKNNKKCIEKKLTETKKLLEDLGLPKAQQNDRSARGLLALLSLKCNQNWDESTRPLIQGTHSMFSFINQHYDFSYAENSRETMRKDTIDPFEMYDLIEKNSDDPDRATNSNKTNYRITSKTLKLIQSYNTKSWKKNLKNFHSQVKTPKTNSLSFNYNGQLYTLSPGGQSQTIVDIVQNFRSNFCKNTKILYIGDTKTKWIIDEAEYLKTLGFKIKKHGKMPDVILYDESEKILFLLEAVTSHGPFDEKRKYEMAKIFDNKKIKLEFITAFPSKLLKNSSTNLTKIAWGTCVWYADEPEHLIYFH